MIRIRAATITDAEALAHVMLEAITTTFRDIVPEQCLTWIAFEESATNWRRTLSPGGLDEGECLLVAEEGAGFAMARIRPDDPIYQGELAVINVRPAYQRQGIGRLLIQCVVEHLARQDIHSLLVRVITTNPNRGFYERLGGRYLRDEPYDWNGIALAEALYRWTDTTSITAI